MSEPRRSERKNKGQTSRYDPDEYQTTESDRQVLEERRRQQEEKARVVAAQKAQYARDNAARIVLRGQEHAAKKIRIQLTNRRVAFKHDPRYNYGFDAYLHNLYYKKKFMFGRDRIFEYLKGDPLGKNLQLRGLSQKYVNEWLKRQEVAALHSSGPGILQQRHNIQRRVMTAPFKVWAMDLVDMSGQEKSGKSWILTMQDMFSKYCFAIPMIDKSERSLVDALLEAFAESESIFGWNFPSAIQSDNGSEFVSAVTKKFLTDFGIKQIFSIPGRPQSNGMIERFNKSLKRFFSMAQSQTGLIDWPKLCSVFTDNYNNSVNPVLKSTPMDVMKNRADPGKEASWYSKLSLNAQRTGRPVRQGLSIRYKPGDLVRLKIVRTKYQKSHGLNWTRQAYKVVSVRMSKPYGPNFRVPLYQIKNNTTDALEDHLVYNEDLIPFVKSTTDLHKDAKDPTTNILNYIIRPQLDFKDMPDFYDPTMNEKQPTFVVRYIGDSKGHYATYDQLRHMAPKTLKWFTKRHNLEIDWVLQKMKWDGVTGTKRKYSVV